MKYTFGTTSEAASRLEAIADFFNPLASRLVRRYAGRSAKAAVDVGCGPGFTTDMLYNAVKCPNVYGLDNSTRFLSQARKRFPHCIFMKHDITKVPFPVQGDVIYVRFVLSHLQNVVSLVNSWTTQLAPGGTLLIEEVEAVDTEVGVFKTYLSVNTAVVASQGTSLFVGAELAEGAYDADVLANDCAVLPVANSRAASWFLPNTRTIWKGNECVLQRLSPAEAEEISRELSSIADSGDPASDITWKMRRLVLRRK